MGGGCGINLELTWQDAKNWQGQMPSIVKAVKLRIEAAESLIL